MNTAPRAPGQAARQNSDTASLLDTIRKSLIRNSFVTRLREYHDSLRRVPRFSPPRKGFACYTSFADPGILFWSGLVEHFIYSLPDRFLSAWQGATSADYLRMATVVICLGWLVSKMNSR